MGRGRPKGSKNKKTLERESTGLFDSPVETTERIVENPPKINNSEEDNITTPEEKETINEPIKPKKVMANCDKCGADIYCSPITANLSHLTGQATWHRTCRLDKLRLCSSCAQDLNNLIDTWILKDHPEYYKWGAYKQEKETTTEENQENFEDSLKDS